MHPVNDFTHPYAPVVAALVLDEHGRILMARAHADMPWHIPVTHLMPEETPAAAVIRTVRQRTGFAVTVMRLAGVYAGRLLTDGIAGHLTRGLVFTFVCQVIGGVLREGQAAFMPPEQLAGPGMGGRGRQLLADALRSGEAVYFAPSTWEPGRSRGTLPAGRGATGRLHALVEEAGGAPVFTNIAAGLVFDGEGRILLQHRRDLNVWGPPGGLIEPYEQPASAAAREVWEESGLVVEPLRVVGVFGGPAYHIQLAEQMVVAVTAVMFACRVIAGDLRADGTESLRVGFFSPEDILNDAVPPLRVDWRMKYALRQRGRRPYFDPPEGPLMPDDDG